jgi:hypothetical protein
MPEFQVELAHTQVDYLVITVTANTAQEAEEVALDKLHDEEVFGAKWDEGTSEYTATVVTAPALVSDTN